MYGIALLQHFFITLLHYPITLLSYSSLGYDSDDLHWLPMLRCSIVLHPILGSYVFQRHWYLVTDLFVLQLRMILLSLHPILPHFSMEALPWSAPHTGACFHATYNMSSSFLCFNFCPFYSIMQLTIYCFSAAAFHVMFLVPVLFRNSITSVYFKCSFSSLFVRDLVCLEQFN